MAIYEHNELLKLFSTFRVLDEDATMMEYTVVVEGGLIFDLHIWPYDEYASIMLLRPDKESWLFDVAIDHLDKIIYDGVALKIFRDENKNEPALVVTIKPHISLQCRAAAPEDR